MNFDDYESEEDERDYNRWLAEFSKSSCVLTKRKTRITDVSDDDYDGIDPIFNLGTKQNG